MIRRSSRGGREAMTRRGPLIWALALYVLWTSATYLLEGRPRTFLQPEAVGLRLVYVVAANLIVGIGLSILVVRRLRSGGVATLRQLGFRRMSRTAASILLALILGFGGYVAQDPPSLNSVVVLNGFAQVLAVSIAEVLVCWIVVGRSIEAALRGRGRGVKWAGPLLASAVLFGVYHYAHSPPFNTHEMVVFLSAIGLVTGAFFLVSREVYGTIVFHNFLALFGVLEALEEAGTLEVYAEPQVPILVTAAVAVGTLLFLDWAGLRRTGSAQAA